MKISNLWKQKQHVELLCLKLAARQTREAVSASRITSQSSLEQRLFKTLNLAL